MEIINNEMSDSMKAFGESAVTSATFMGVFITSSFSLVAGADIATNSFSAVANTLNTATDSDVANIAMDSMRAAKDAAVTAFNEMRYTGTFSLDVYTAFGCGALWGGGTCVVYNQLGIITDNIKNKYNYSRYAGAGWMTGLAGATALSFFIFSNEFSNDMPQIGTEETRDVTEIQFEGDCPNKADIKRMDNGSYQVELPNGCRLVTP